MKTVLKLFIFFGCFGFLNAQSYADVDGTGTLQNAETCTTVETGFSLTFFTDVADGTEPNLRFEIDVPSNYDATSITSTSYIKINSVNYPLTDYFDVTAVAGKITLTLNLNSSAVPINMFDQPSLNFFLKVVNVFPATATDQHFFVKTFEDNVQVTTTFSDMGAVTNYNTTSGIPHPGINISGCLAAANDNYGVVVAGGTTPSVFSNDTSSFGLTPNTTPDGVDTSVTLTDLGGLTGATINSNGTINVPAGAAPGTYVLTYQICSPEATGPCTTATATLIIQQPFTCSDARYVSQIISGDTSTTLTTLNLNGTYTPIGTASGKTYNGIGYNVIDNFIYALIKPVSGATNPTNLFRIDANGVLYDMGPITGSTSLGATIVNASGVYIGPSGASGTMDNSGNLYIKATGSTSVLYKIKVSDRTVTAVSLSTSIATNDLAYNPVDGFIYYQNAGFLGKINLTTGAVTAPINSTAHSSPTTFGAFFSDGLGNVYGNDNNGGFYQFDTATGERLLIHNSDSNQSNDGTMCQTAEFKYEADLSITKNDNVDIYTAGGTTTYAIVVKNNSADYGVMNAKVTDLLPTGITAANITSISYTPGAGANRTAVTPATPSTHIINDLVDLPAGATFTYSVTIAIPASFTGSLVNTATVTAPSNVTDADTSNNEMTDTDTNLCTITASNPDSDSDGISNACDLDDDNDGILDIDEMCVVPPGTVGTIDSTLSGWQPSGMTATAGTKIYNTLSSVAGYTTGVALDGPFAGLTINVAKTSPNLGAAIIGNQSYQYWTAGVDAWKLYVQTGPPVYNGDEELSISAYPVSTLRAYTWNAMVDVDNSGTWTTGDEYLGYVDLYSTAAWYNTPTKSGPIRLLMADVSFTDNETTANISQTTYADCDFDGDGIPNRLDLDSDADGCPDAVEGGGVYALTNLVTSTMPGGTTNVTQNFPTPVGSGSTTLGVPTFVGSGQTIGSSQNSAVKAAVCSVCYETPTDLASSVPVNHGITVLGRAGATNGNWPMLRNSAYTALESKTKGFVITRNANPETSIANPVIGMMVFDTDADAGKGCLKINTDGTSTGWKCFNVQTCP